MPAAANFRSRALLLIAALGLVAGTIWLRSPSFGFKVWNVDEAIHAAIALTLLEGGVLYRDAVDIRSPLTYYTMAAMFAGFGENNLWAVHCGIAGLIASTGWLLFLAGRVLRGPAVGAAAAVLYVLLATGAFYQGDANAANTEWFVAFFSSAAAAVFLMGGSTPGLPRLFATGLLFGLAFLSKQPALIEMIAPLMALLFLGKRQALRAAPLVRQVLVTVAGWITPVLLTVAFFGAHGALGEAFFYTWTYPLTYYGPEITTLDRLGALATPFQLLGSTQPLLLLIWMTGAATILYRIARLPSLFAGNESHPGLVFLVGWSVAGLIGSASSGRSFDHYTIQFLAPFCLGAALALARMITWAGTGPARRALRVGATILLGVVVYQAGSTALVARQRTLPPDPSLRIAAFIRQHSQSSDKIFVWGFHPDIYLHADRRPASRYVIASFLSGLIPWTNTAPDQDTTNAIVPGTMAKLLADLAEQRPVFIVDCSPGPNRSWNKYPLEKFPRLREFVSKHYLPIESGQFVPQGFRLFAIKDSFRIRRPEVNPIAAPPGRTGRVEIFAPRYVVGDAPWIKVAVGDSAARLQRVELRLNGNLLDGVTIQPGSGFIVDFALPAELPPGLHRLDARAICADGVEFKSSEQEIDTRGVGLPDSELPAFRIGLSDGSMIPQSVFAPYGASVSVEDRRTYFFLHAPSRVTYALPAGARLVSGGYGIRPEASAPENPSPTDGAEFEVYLETADGGQVTLHREILHPEAGTAERGFSSFQIQLPALHGARIVFVINPGPSGDVASDWTYWVDLAVEISR
ncbi:MAG: glycosyltransferase family 39 protein [Candidatus Didemnitutus sp.]|nr:glycosyltransferase family 39 protein [Candidatus Didemnitutus sp.]